MTTEQTADLDRLRGRIKTLEGEMTAERTRVEEAGKRREGLEGELKDLGFDPQDANAQIDTMIADARTALEGVEKNLQSLQVEMVETG